MRHPHTSHEHHNHTPGQIRRQRGRGPRGGGFGPGFGPGMGFGPDMFGFGPGRGGRGPRVRRGDVRQAILDVLANADGDLNGYQIISAIEEKSDGAWKPSPGSVYPTISQLEDEGLVEVAREAGKKVVRLTADGKTHVAEHADEISAVWKAFDHAEHGHGQELKQILRQTMGAVSEIFATGTPAQQERAVQLLDETRRKLYGLLAAGPDAD